MRTRCCRRISAPAVFLLAAFWCVPALRADKVPDWFQQLTKETLPEYPARTDGVVLLDDCTLTVKDAQSITKNCREVRKILRHEGRDLGQFHFDFNKDNKLTYLKGWSIGVKGQQYELKEKDAIEYRPFSEDILYDDARYKVLLMPAAEAGAYVAVESEQKERPYVLQDAWFFHKRIPIRKSRFTLLLPPNWEFEYRFANWKEFKPQRSGANQWTWEINDVPGFEEEDRMPDESAVTGHMVVSFYPPGRQGTRMSSWPDVGAWADSLNASRRVVTPAMHQRVLELTADARTPLGKIQALADFLQREIRYVAIEIRIGGIQAHMAGDIFSNRYGDCKDKATLLATMLGDVGIESYLVLVHTGHGVTVPETPYAYSFNHAILAIKLPEGTDASKLYAVVDDQKLGKLLIFDPTNQAVPVGLLPYYEEGNYALVVLPNGGQLVQLPLLAPNLNRRLRTGSLELQPDGAVSGQIDDLLTGNLAARMRRMLLDAKGTDRLKIVEDMFAENFGQYRLTSARQENLERYDQPLVLHYKFEALNYGQSAGGLMLVRPRVMGIMHWSDEHWGDAKAKPRQFPVILPMGPISESDAFDIKVPAGYEIDELPPPVEAVYPFAEYHSSTEMKDGVLRFRRKYVVKDVMIPLGQMEQFKNFEGRISDDEREMAVLKKSAAVSQAAPGTPK